MTATFGQFNRFRRWGIFGAAICLLFAGSVNSALAQAVPGGTLNPLTIPKYVTPLVIPPVMNPHWNGQRLRHRGPAVQQQILPGGIWNPAQRSVRTPLPADHSLELRTGRRRPVLQSPIWSLPSANSQFNYPAYTIENTVNTQTTRGLDQRPY